MRAITEGPGPMQNAAPGEIVKSGQSQRRG